MNAPRIRVYIGNLDPSFTQQEMENEVRRFGPTKSVWVARSPAGFAFIEFETEDCAQACIEGLHDAKLGQSNVMVQFAKTNGRKEPPKPQLRGGPDGAVKHRAVLKNLPPSFSWRELKDEMRRIGNVIYADMDGNGDGIVEFSSADDLEYAVRRLDGSRLDGNEIRVFREGGGPSYSGGGAPQPPPAAGYDHNSRGNDPRGGVGYDDRGGAYDSRAPGYDDRRYDDRRYDDRGGAYDRGGGGAYGGGYDQRYDPYRERERDGGYGRGDGVVVVGGGGYRRDEGYRRDDGYRREEPRRDDPYARGGQSYGPPPGEYDQGYGPPRQRHDPRGYDDRRYGDRRD